jgi:hypothetical protein
MGFDAESQRDNTVYGGIISLSFFLFSTSGF